MSAVSNGACTLRLLFDAECPAWRFPSEQPPQPVAAAVAPLPTGIALFASVCVPFYSERGPSLRRSLEALALQQEDIKLSKEDGALHVFAIGDGWRSRDGGRVLSESMLAELEALFGAPLDAPLEAALSAEGGGEIAVIQRLAPTGELAPIMLDVSAGRRTRARENSFCDTNFEGTAAASLPLFLTVLVKRRNRKKADSHAWFFGALAPLARLRAGGDLFFTTDCGTLFSPALLTRLSAHLAAHPRAGAVTGHQRVMYIEDQADPPGAALPAGAIALRSVQGFDFESQLCLFNGAHALAGFLPVIPGPCGLFRASALPHELVSRLRAAFESDGAAADGLVLANLKLAEDRLLSYLLLLEGGWETHWEPAAVFYFEFETTLSELVLQRRRWLNGTNAGLLWLLSRAELIRALPRCSLLPCAAAALSATELVIAAIVFLLPAVFAFTGFIAIGHLAIAAEAVGLLRPAAATFGVRGAHGALVVPTQVAYLALALPSFVLHVRAARAGVRGGAGEALWASRRLLGAFVMLASLAGTLALLCLCLVAPAVLTAQVGAWDVNDIRLTAAFCLHFLATPFCLAALHSHASLSAMLAAFPAFLTFFPVISADFFSYALARLDDLTWGTKYVGGGGVKIGDGIRSSAGTSGGVVASGSGEDDPAVRAFARRQALRDQERGFAPAATAPAAPAPVPSAARTAAAYCTTATAVIHVLANSALLLALIAHSEELEHNFARTAPLLAGPPAAFALASMAYFARRELCGASRTACGGAAAAATLAGWLAASAAVAVLVMRDTEEEIIGDGALPAFLAAYALVATAQVLRAFVEGRGRSSRGSGIYCPRSVAALPACLRVTASTAAAALPRVSASVAGGSCGGLRSMIVMASVTAILLIARALAPSLGAGLLQPASDQALAPAAPTPRPDRTTPLAAGARILEYLHSRGEALTVTVPAPVRAVYLDARDLDWNDPGATILAAVNASFNVIHLAFAVGGPDGATDALGAWLAGGAWTQRHNATVAAAHARGAVLLLSAGGATDDSYFRKDAATYGAALAAAALAGQLDGVDMNLERFGPGCSLPGLPPSQAVAWVVRATRAARVALGPLPLLTHAPLAAYLSAPGVSDEAALLAGAWAGPTGCYSAIYARARAHDGGEPDIDWLALQYYNQGAHCYVSYESIFIDSGAASAPTCYRGTALAQVASYGVPLSALVVGKVAAPGDAADGFVAPDTLAAWAHRARNDLGWRAGVMLWQWDREAGPAWARALDSQGV